MPSGKGLFIAMLGCCLLGFGWGSSAAAGDAGRRLAQAPQQQPGQPRQRSGSTRPAPGQPGQQPRRQGTPAGRTGNAPRPGQGPVGGFHSGRGSGGGPQQQPGRGPGGSHWGRGPVGGPQHHGRGPVGHHPGRGPHGGLPPNNPCVVSYQQCAMLCRGNVNCVANCNMGFAVCRQQNGY